MGSTESVVVTIPTKDDTSLSGGDKHSFSMTSCVDDDKIPAILQEPAGLIAAPKPGPNPDDDLLPSSPCTNDDSTQLTPSTDASQGHGNLSANSNPQKEEIKVGWSPIHIAASTGNLAVLKGLCELGVDKDKAKSDGLTPLHIAAVNGNLDMVIYLVEQGADKDKANNDGWTALFRAAANAHLPVVRYLVEQGMLTTNNTLTYPFLGLALTQPFIPFDLLTHPSLSSWTPRCRQEQDHQRRSDAIAYR